MKLIKYHSTLILLALTMISQLPLSGQSIQDIVESGDKERIKSFIDDRGADHCEEGWNLVNSLIRTRQLDLLQECIAYGLDINATCENGRSALMTAAKYNLIEEGQYLLKNGANLGLKDQNDLTALDHAHRNNQIEFLQKVYNIKMDYFADVDGPYIFIEDDKMTTYEIVKDENGVKSVTEAVEDATGQHLFSCYDEDGETLFSFQLHQEKYKSKSSYGAPKKIVAISDIEGELDAFVNLLKATEVVNEQLEWTFGNGHLVLVGDFFDRGTQVTECLWLIYKLEAEAEVMGGKVHFILGNHELMNLRGDWRYVQKKYLINAQMMGLSYGDLFGPNTVLGAWLRTKNSMVKIGSNLFVHGGLHPDFKLAAMSIKQVNDGIRQLIDATEEQIDKYPNGGFLMYDYGPLWYRGHFGNEHTQKELEDVLYEFGAKRMIIGHTPVEKIKTLYENRIIAIDVAHSKGPTAQAALLIEKNKLSSVNVEGEKREI